jgi:GTP-binding protein Era
VDVILFLVDIEAGFGRGDEFILEKIKDTGLPIFLILNKVDKVKKDKLLEIIQTLSEKYAFQEIFPLSALKGDNVKNLIETLKKYMPNEGKIFEDDTFTNITTNFYVSEIVREKVLLKTREEVPHSVTCVVESLENKKDKVIIQVLIIVDRLSVKKIIVGKNASMLKEIGIDARHDLEKYFNKKVYLKLFVKVVNNWKEEEKYLKEFDIIEGE